MAKNFVMTDPNAPDGAENVFDIPPENLKEARASGLVIVQKQPGTEVPSAKFDHYPPEERTTLEKIKKGVEDAAGDPGIGNLIAATTGPITGAGRVIGNAAKSSVEKVSSALASKTDAIRGIPKGITEYGAPVSNAERVAASRPAPPGSPAPPPAAPGASAPVKRTIPKRVLDAIVNRLIHSAVGRTGATIGLWEGAKGAYKAWGDE